jgi:hypothetical protein
MGKYLRMIDPLSSRIGQDAAASRSDLDPFDHAQTIGHQCELASQNPAAHLSANRGLLISEKHDHSSTSPAESIVETCRRHSVSLRVDSEGTLLFESCGMAWHILIEAIKIHSQEIARIVVTTAEARIDVVRADA